MKTPAMVLAVALGILPTVAAAQMPANASNASARPMAQAASMNPVSDALRSTEQRIGRNLVAALDAFPADKYGYKPTDAQMTVGAIALQSDGKILIGGDFRRIFYRLIILVQPHEYGRASGYITPLGNHIIRTFPEQDKVLEIFQEFNF